MYRDVAQYQCVTWTSDRHQV